jgi:glycosyltransferase involved in cell wall biosynthesis
MNKKVKLSIVVPLYNEAANVTPLYVRLTQVMQDLGGSYEIVLVDDGSKDETPAALRAISATDSRVQVVTLRRNFGQTPALQAGFDAACGDIIISMDGDLQHDPEEIPAFVEKLEEGYDIVSGWRAQRRDGWLLRRLPSRIANWLMAKISRVPLHDFGTTFKAYRRETVKSLRLYGELHRFVPALAAWYGARITEIPISNPPRQNGKSNYGISRTLRVFLDLLSTKFLLDYSTRPLHFFGPIGLLATGAGALMGFGLVLNKLFGQHAIMLQAWPLLVASMALVLGGVVILCLGLVSELLSRTYYESQGKAIYALRTSQNERWIDEPIRADKLADERVRAIR